jgi:hypothetical protein
VLTTLLNFTVGGTVYSVAVVEAASAADTPAAQAVFRSALTETANAADTPASRAIFKPAVTEAASAADTPTSRAVFKPAVSEAASASDAPASRAIFKPAITEAATAADTTAVGSIYRASLTDAATAADITAVGSRYRAALVDAAAAVDSDNSANQFARACRETLAALDAPDAGFYTVVQAGAAQLALDTAFGSAAVVRSFPPPVSRPLARNQAVTLFVSLGYAIQPSQVFAAILTTPGGSQVAVASQYLDTRFVDLPTPLGQFAAGTYTTCYLSPGVLSAPGRWSIVVTDGLFTSSPAFFNVA